MDHRVCRSERLLFTADSTACSLCHEKKKTGDVETSRDGYRVVAWRTTAADRVVAVPKAESGKKTKQNKKVHIPTTRASARASADVS